MTKSLLAYFFDRETLRKSTLAGKRNDGGNAFDADKVEIIIGKNIDLSLEVIL